MRNSTTIPREATRVAVLADVHGNAVALQAVLQEIATESPDLIVFPGDLTWGPLPEETCALVDSLEVPALFVRGNADRALLEAADASDGAELTARERWMVEQHSSARREFLRTFTETAVVAIGGLGPVRFCHGSPRSDEELITFATPEARMRAALEGVPEQVVVTAHTHIQFDRQVAGHRSVNAGSVGMAYEGRPGGAFWAMLGPDVDLRESAFDLDAAVRRYSATTDPMAEQMVEMLVAPATPAEVVEQAEAQEFAG